jgi:hypothetical protein
MRNFFKPLLSFVALFGLMAVTAMPTQAATPNYNLNSQVEVIPFHISGQYTTSTTAVAKFALPFPAKLIGVSTTARASGGTTPTLTVDVKSGGTTVLSAPISVTAGAVSEGTITTTTLADEATITVDLTIGGTSPTWNDITLLLTVVRR